MKLKHWFKSLISETLPKKIEPVHGCHLNSAQRVSEGDLRRIIQKIEELKPWFHNYEIASGVWTNPSGAQPGIEYPLARWRLVETLLPDVKGKSCLDIACSSGFFSLKLKELGAGYVLGLDMGEQPQAIEQARFAADTLGLDVDFRSLSAYDVATLGRKFDIVLFMGLFYHLRHPLVALEAARAVCSKTMIFQTITTGHHQRKLTERRRAARNLELNSPMMSDGQVPSLHFVEGALNGDGSCWFVPNIDGAAAILRSCGFTLEQMICTNDHDVIVRCG
ncbi:MAG TPA: DUF1698 domain-containing protein [Terriglobia bacterium]